jgi:hypothetical protein
MKKQNTLIALLSLTIVGLVACGGDNLADEASKIDGGNLEENIKTGDDKGNIGVTFGPENKPGTQEEEKEAPKSPVHFVLAATDSDGTRVLEGFDPNQEFTVEPGQSILKCDHKDLSKARYFLMSETALSSLGKVEDAYAMAMNINYSYDPSMLFDGFAGSLAYLHGQKLTAKKEIKAVCSVL